MNRSGLLVARRTDQLADLSGSDLYHSIGSKPIFEYPLNAKTGITPALLNRFL